MGSSGGLIVAFVVVVWAAYFIPLALRRYDEASNNASIETTGALSRVISRQAATTAPPESASTASQSAPSPQTTSRTISRPAARLAARRRRRTLQVLTGLLVVVGAAVGVGVLATPILAVPALLIVAWLVACRVQVRGELGITRQRKVRSTGAASMEDEDTVIVSGHFEDINPGRKHQMESLPLEGNALDDQIVIAVPSVSTAGEALWDPLPVTLPTYVTKPRAGRTVRTIDFSQPGTWTSGHIEGENVELPKREDRPEEQRRATGT